MAWIRKCLQHIWIFISDVSRALNLECFTLKVCHSRILVQWDSNKYCSMKKYEVWKNMYCQGCVNNMMSEYMRCDDFF